MYPNSLKNLIECLKDLPGIGEKSAERLAFSILNFDKEKLTFFSDAINGIRDNITRCPICNNICENDSCYLCNSDSRQHDTIFVVESVKDVVLFEKLGIYDGLYHVIDGLISPLDGINPEDIKLDTLIKRINDNDIKELIIALKPSIEGETTTQYIKKILENKQIKISRIASGVPIGADMEYIDAMTLEMAIDERKDIS